MQAKAALASRGPAAGPVEALAGAAHRLETDHLHQLIKGYMELAHLPTLKKRRGMHSLRHTLASVLLENNTPLCVISDILGHVDTDSTAVYLKVDLQKLKECPLDFE